MHIHHAPPSSTLERWTRAAIAVLVALALVVGTPSSASAADADANYYMHAFIWYGPTTVTEGTRPQFMVTVEGIAPHSVSKLTFSGSCSGALGTMTTGGYFQFTCTFDEPVQLGEDLVITLDGRGHVWRPIGPGVATSLHLTRDLEVVPAT